jgi:hypothetical protein
VRVEQTSLVLKTAQYEGDFPGMRHRLDLSLVFPSQDARRSEFRALEPRGKYGMEVQMLRKTGGGEQITIQSKGQNPDECMKEDMCAGQLHDRLECCSEGCRQT